MTWYEMTHIGIDINSNEPVSIPSEIRPMGVSIIGKTGYGKSTLLSSLIDEDIRQGTTAIVIDPHGDLCKTVIASTPAEQIDRVVYLPIDPNYPFGINPFQINDVADPIKVDNAIDGVQQIFRKLMGSDQVYLRTDRVIRAIAYTLVEQQGHTMADVLPLLQNKAFRHKIVAQVTDPVTRAFWEEYEESYGNLMIRRDFVDPVLNRIDMFMSRRFVRRILSQKETTLDFSHIINSHKTYLVSLPVGTLGAGITELLGTIILFHLANAIYARAETDYRPPVHLYIDEFHRFTLSNITASLLKEGRKFGLGTTITIQVLSDLKDEENRNAFFQAGTLLAFQTTGEDAKVIAYQFNAEPPPGEKQYKPQMEPVYEEWNEIVWTDEEKKIEWEKWAYDEKNRWDKGINEVEKDWKEVRGKLPSDHPAYVDAEKAIRKMIDAYIDKIDYYEKIRLMYQKTEHHKELKGYRPIIDHDYYSKSVSRYGSSIGVEMAKRYEETQGQQRLFSDVREEVSTKLSTLSRFEALMTMPGFSSSIEHHIRLNEPVPAPDNPLAMAKAVEQGRQLFGRPWKEIDRKIAEPKQVEETEENRLMPTDTSEESTYRPRMKPHKAHTKNLPESGKDSSHG